MISRDADWISYSSETSSTMTGGIKEAAPSPLAPGQARNRHGAGTGDGSRAEPGAGPGTSPTAILRRRRAPADPAR
jgi:hypothetical protein